MIVLDSTVVNIAIPSIQEDLKVSESSLVWIVSAYTLTFGSSLLLGGRLGDLYGQRRMFLIGILVFTVASLAAGLSSSSYCLIAARAIQGIGGAIVAAVVLSLILNMFADQPEQAKALAVYGFVCAGGGSAGLFIGGALLSTSDWHWIFLVNLPIGLAVYALCRSLLPDTRTKSSIRQLDIWGAVLVATSLMTAVYGIVNSSSVGWSSTYSICLFVLAAIIFLLFVLVELRVSTPLIPIGTFRLRNLTIANAIGVLWAAGNSVWFFVAALYMELVLGYSPMRVGLAFLPVNLITAAFALGASGRLVSRFGIKKPLGFGLLLVAIGLALFARVPVNGSLTVDISPAMIFLGIGAGVAYTPLLIAATSDVAASESGLASGIFNTTSLLGGAVGLAALASLSELRANDLMASGLPNRVALTAGFQLAFLISAICVAMAALGAAFLQAKCIGNATGG
jgi:EmrB/QacA subfamily drug resistance transporter